MMGVESFIPQPLLNPYRRLRSRLKNSRFGKSNSAVFDTIYDKSLWGQGNSGDLYSGSGSYDASVKVYVDFVADFIMKHDIHDVLEIGCGDFAVASQYISDEMIYHGVDVSAKIVERNKKLFGKANVTFEQADASKVTLRPRQLCIVRQVLQHLDNSSIKGVLENVRAHKYVLITEHLLPADAQVKPNIDKSSGPDTRLTFGSGVYIELPPFSCGGEIVLVTPVNDPQVGPGEVLRTTLLTN